MNRPCFMSCCAGCSCADVDIALSEGIQEGSLAKLEQHVLLAVTEKLDTKSRADAIAFLRRAQSAGFHIQGALEHCSRESDDQANADLLNAALQVRIRFRFPRCSCQQG